MERQALGAAVHVVVGELEEAGDAGRAGEARAGGGRPHLFLLHLEDHVHVAAVGGLEIHAHILEQAEA